MKKWIFNLPVKLLALLLASLCVFFTVASGLGVMLLLHLDGFRTDDDGLQEKLMTRRYSYVLHEIASFYSTQDNFRSYVADLQSTVNCEIVIESYGGVVYSDRSEREYVTCIEENLYFVSDVYYSSEGNYEDEWYKVSLYLFEPLQGSDLEFDLQLLLFLHRYRVEMIYVLGISFVAFVFLFSFLCVAAGRKGNGETGVNFFHRVPLELYPFVLGPIVFLLEVWVYNLASSQNWFVLLCGAVFLFADAFLVLLVVMTFAVRCKRKKLLETTLLGKSLSVIKKLCGIAIRFLQNVRLVPRVALILTAIAIFDYTLTMVLSKHECYAVFLLEGLILSAFLIWYAASVQRLEKTAEEIAKGNLRARCDLTLLPWGLRSFGGKMNSGADGMEKAVEEKMKSERFKTELITNVSHDIKTPLTSIVNFVDLMKKENIENEKVREYLEVLDRQSSRLKKLTEDLVESSKAVSGVYPVHLAPCDVAVLLSQAMGEYQSQLEEKGLIPCLSVSEESVMVMADGKMLWRVLDNLFRNIEKYALRGSRVYVNLETRDRQVDLIFRNISANPLPLSASSLTERFVRGDLSRNTEGSGLGLSIAQSLTQLQKGNLTLSVDGDLFKAIITFDRI